MDSVLAVGDLANNMEPKQIRIFKSLYEDIISSHLNRRADADLYSAQTKEWLTEKLTAVIRSEPEKFVIVMTHPMIANTVYGSELCGGA